MTNEQKARNIARDIRVFLNEHSKEVHGYIHQLEGTANYFDVIADRFARREG